MSVAVTWSRPAEHRLPVERRTPDSRRAQPSPPAESSCSQHGLRVHDQRLVEQRAGSSSAVRKSGANISASVAPEAASGRGGMRARATSWAPRLGRSAARARRRRASDPLAGSTPSSGRARRRTHPDPPDVARPLRRISRGVAVVVCRPRWSQPEPSSHSRGRGRDRRPPAPSWPSASRSRPARGPGSPARAARSAVSGEAAVPEGERGVRRDDVGRVGDEESNRSPMTGSSRLPARSSTFVTPFRARLKAANPSARPFTSVATTCSAWRESRSAWIPFPVQTSSARSTGSRMVRCASTAEGRWTPATRSAAVDVEPVGRDQEVVVGDDAHEPVHVVAALGETPRDEHAEFVGAMLGGQLGTGSPSSSSEMSAARPSAAASRRRYTSRSRA